jgi:hypothetical protein
LSLVIDGAEDLATRDADEGANPWVEGKIRSARKAAGKRGNIFDFNFSAPL